MGKIEDSPRFKSLKRSIKEIVECDKETDTAMRCPYAVKFELSTEVAAGDYNVEFERDFILCTKFRRNWREDKIIHICEDNS
jgi:hypothetical protein